MCDSARKQKKEIKDTEIIVIFGRKKRSPQFREHGRCMFQGFL